MRRIGVFFIVVVFTLSGLASCSSKPPKRAAKARARQVAKKQQEEKIIIPAKPEKFTIKKVEYNPAGKRDPFLSIVSLTKQKVKKKKKKSLNPLENFDVADFKLLGVIYDGKNYYASILLPDGKAFTVKEGMHLGLYGGTIQKIDETSLTIREEVLNYKGEKEDKITVLKLRKEEE